MLNAYFWGDRIYFWTDHVCFGGDNVYFWGDNIYFWLLLGILENFRVLEVYFPVSPYPLNLGGAISPPNNLRGGVSETPSFYSAFWGAAP